MIVTVYLARYRIEPSCLDVVWTGIFCYRHDNDFFDLTVPDRFLVPEEEAVFTGIGVAFKKQSSAGTVGGQFVGLCAVGTTSNRSVNERLAEWQIISFLHMRTSGIGADRE